MESSVPCRFMMTAVPSLKRSATSRASLNRFGSDLWIAADAPTWRGAAIVRTTPSASEDTSRTGWGRMRRTGAGSTSGSSSTNSSSSSTRPR